MTEIGSGPSDPAIAVEHVEKRFGKTVALNGVSFDVRPGEVFALLGPNGAGKTTLVNILATLIRPDGGNATIAGHRLDWEPAEVRRAIGVVPQEIALYDALTARQNLRFWGTMYGMSGSRLEARISGLLERLELSKRAGDRLATYSGGMKRRINIAAGLIHEPEVLFLDEPTVGIDPQNRRRILDMIKEFTGEGITVVYTTHYMEEAEELADRVGIIDHGRIIAMGTRDELVKLIGISEQIRLVLASGCDGRSHGECFEDLSFIDRVIETDKGIVFEARDARAALPDVIRRATEHEVELESVDIVKPNLESVFLHMTGRELRD